MNQPCTRSALKFDLFADQARQRKIEALGDPLQVIAKHIDFDHLAGVIDGLCPRADTRKGGRPPYPTAVMVRILVLKYLNDLSDEQVEYQLLDRMSFQRFCLLSDSANVPDRNTIWHYQQRLGARNEQAQPGWQERQQIDDAEKTGGVPPWLPHRHQPQDILECEDRGQYPFEHHHRTLCARRQIAHGPPCSPSGRSRR
jgi:hypothetical protein